MGTQRSVFRKVASSQFVDSKDGGGTCFFSLIVLNGINIFIAGEHDFCKRYIVFKIERVKMLVSFYFAGETEL